MTRVVGIVQKHKGNGRKFGYPTANIPVTPEHEEGVFTGWTYLEGKKLPSIVFIGAAETLGETNKRLESYILDFPDRDLYGEKIEVEILKKLRENKKFPSVANLITQMKRDEKDARLIFADLR